jgi:hypothetical protein
VIDEADALLLSGNHLDSSGICWLFKGDFSGCRLAISQAFRVPVLTHRGAPPGCAML